MFTHDSIHRCFCSPLARTLLTCASVVLSLAACDLGEDSLDVELRNGGYSCPRWQCGYNTSEINGKSLTELDLDGQANADGVRLVGFISPLGLLGYELEVDGDSLVATSDWFLSPDLSGPDLVGSTLWIDTGALLDIPVVIAGYEQVGSWADGSPPVDAYSLIYEDLDNGVDLSVELDLLGLLGFDMASSVCKGTLVDPLQASVVILAGETYDSETKQINTDQDGWITLACAGSATAKTALLGYGPHGDLGGRGSPASVDERQATLNMLTANYCGDGHSYTDDGTALAWQNDDQSVLPFAVPGVSEAVWTADGALCLDTPRFVAREDVACALPSCANFELADGEWITHNPDN